MKNISKKDNSMNGKLIDIDSMFMTVYSLPIDKIADKLHSGERSISYYRKLEIIPDLGLPSVDLNLLLIYINAENDKVLTSNEKKILNLLILGGEASVDPDKHLECDPKADQRLYKYFEDLKKDKDQKGKSTALPYRPGRSVARYQIWTLGNRYGYSTSGINIALKRLSGTGLVEFHPDSTKQNKYDRFKLSVRGCADYLESKKKTSKTQ